MPAPPPQGGYAPPPPPGGGYAPQAGAYAVAAPNEGSALLSLILGILGIICCPILAPVAFFIGNSSMGKIRASNGALGGLGLAQAGRILGIVGTVLFALEILLVIVNIFVGLGGARTTG